MRVTVTRLALVPLVTVAAVVAAPRFVGDHPVTWDGVRRGAVAQVSRLPGHPFAPAPPVEGTDAGPWAEPVPLPTTKALRDTYPVAPVHRRWKPGAPQLGVQVYWEASPTDLATTWGQAQRIVNYVTSLNADSVTISFPFFMRDITASAVGPGAATPSPHRMEVLLHEAALAGLRVTLRPILDEKSLDPPKGWRGNIRPSSKDAWFDSYQAFLRPYLEVARRQKAATFVVGTELNSMETSPRWRTMVASFRSVFGGELLYDLNYDNYLKGLHPRGVDGYGVDAYMKVKAPPTAGPSVVTAGWNAFFDKVKPSAPRGVLLGEVGIGARRGAFSSPGDYTSPGVFDPRVQATWYQGVCAVARQRGFAGIYFWKVDFAADPAHPVSAGRPNLDFVGHPASERAIRSCLAKPWRVSADAPTRRTPAAGPNGG